MSGKADSQGLSYKVYKDKRKEELAKEHAKYSKCPKQKYYRDPTSLSANIENDCAIGETFPESGTSFQPISLDQALATSNSCIELEEAEYAEAMKDAYYCDELTKASIQDDLGTYLWQEQQRSSAKIKSLEDALNQYIYVCSAVMDAKLAQQVADRGIDALIDKALPKPPPKKSKPNKSGKKKTKSKKGR